MTAPRPLRILRRQPDEEDAELDRLRQEIASLDAELQQLRGS